MWRCCAAECLHHVRSPTQQDLRLLLVALVLLPCKGVLLDAPVQSRPRWEAHFLVLLLLVTLVVPGRAKLPSMPGERLPHDRPTAGPGQDLLPV